MAERAVGTVRPASPPRNFIQNFSAVKFTNVKLQPRPRQAEYTQMSNYYFLRQAPPRQVCFTWNITTFHKEHIYN